MGAPHDQARAARLEAALSTPIEVGFEEQPVEECLSYIAEISKIAILFDRRRLLEQGVELDGLTVSLKVNGIQTRTALELVLEWSHLGYVTRDGIILVTPADRAHEIRVYNVRDLVAPGETSPAGAAGGGSMMGGGPGSGAGLGGMMGGGRGGAGMGGKGGGSGAMMDMMVGGGGGAMAGGMGGTGGGGGMPGAGGMVGGSFGGPMGPPSTLAEVISRTIAPETWTDMGGSGSIVEYNGLLVVKNSQTIHGKIKELLEMMRLATLPAGQPGMMPGGPMPGLMPGAAGPGATGLGAPAADPFGSGTTAPGGVPGTLPPAGASGPAAGAGLGAGTGDATPAINGLSGTFGGVAPPAGGTSPGGRQPAGTNPRRR